MVELTKVIERYERTYVLLYAVKIKETKAQGDFSMSLKSRKNTVM